MRKRSLGEAPSRGLFARSADPQRPAEERAPDHLGHRERLRERFFKDPAALPDYEILEMLLAMAQPRVDTKPAAKALLRAFNDSLADVLSAAPEALKEVDGVGETSVAALKVVREAALRLMNPKGKDMTAISSWTALVGYLTARDAYAETEQFRIVFLDRKNKIISDEAQQKGTVDHTPVYPREVVKRALELNASAIIMVHN